MGPRVGLRAIVSGGNEPVRDAADWTAFYAGDPGTRAIGLFLEAVRRPAAFEAALAPRGRGRQAGDRAQGRALRGRGSQRARALRAPSSAPTAPSTRCATPTAPSASTTTPTGSSTWRPSAAAAGRPAARFVGLTNSGGEGELMADLAEAAGIPFAPLPDRPRGGARRRLPLPRPRQPDRLLGRGRARGDRARRRRPLRARTPTSTACCSTSTRAGASRTASATGSTLDAGLPGGRRCARRGRSARSSRRRPPTPRTTCWRSPPRPASRC